VLYAQVTLQDAVAAVWLMESSCIDSQSSVLGDVIMMAGGGGTAAAGAASQPFPADPDTEYAALQEALVAAVRGGAQQHLLGCG
jgi:hypothetical protein